MEGALVGEVGARDAAGLLSGDERGARLVGEELPDLGGDAVDGVGGGHDAVPQAEEVVVGAEGEDGAEGGDGGGELLADEGEDEEAPAAVGAVLGDGEGPLAAPAVVGVLPLRDDALLEHAEVGACGQRGEVDVVPVAPEVLDGVERAQPLQRVLVVRGGGASGDLVVDPEGPCAVQKDLSATMFRRGSIG